MTRKWKLSLNSFLSECLSITDITGRRYNLLSERAQTSDKLERKIVKKRVPELCIKRGSNGGFWKIAIFLQTILMYVFRLVILSEFKLPGWKILFTLEFCSEINFPSSLVPTWAPIFSYNVWFVSTTLGQQKQGSLRKTSVK